MNSDDNTVTLVAIAKNEAKYIAEWIAYNLAIGFDEIIIFSNDSTDAMNSIISQIKNQDRRIQLFDWPSVDGSSPQVSAYNRSLELVKTKWITFLDIDEFIVPFHDNSINEFLGKLDSGISSIHINWRNFGSSRRESPDYELVTEAFTQCAPAGWGNHHHFKSFARMERVTEAHIHDIVTREGRRVLSDLSEFITEHRGLSNRIVHDGIQINHYQCKTYEEFKDRMQRGDANYASKSAREHTLERFSVLDRNEEEDDRIRRFDAKFLPEYSKIKRCLT